MINGREGCPRAKTHRFKVGKKGKENADLDISDQSDCVGGFLGKLG
jgi:hypothetical protein